MVTLTIGGGGIEPAGTLMVMAISLCRRDPPLRPGAVCAGALVSADLVVEPRMGGSQIGDIRPRQAGLPRHGKGTEVIRRIGQAGGDDRLKDDVPWLIDKAAS